MLMNTARARLLAAKVAELIETASIFQSCYGKDYRMKPGSPTQAWDLYQAMLNQQTAIAGLLDVDALEDAAQRLPQWWKWQESIDTSMVAQMAQEAYHLIACCACFEANPAGNVSPVIACSQRVIAGMLHPSTRMVAMGEMAKAS
jgi:hypothetical protein